MKIDPNNPIPGYDMAEAGRRWRALQNKPSYKGYDWNRSRGRNSRARSRALAGSGKSISGYNRGNPWNTQSRGRSDRRGADRSGYSRWRNDGGMGRTRGDTWNPNWRPDPNAVGPAPNRGTPEGAFKDDNPWWWRGRGGGGMGRPRTGLAGGRGGMWLHDSWGHGGWDRHGNRNKPGGRYGKPFGPRNPNAGATAGGGRWNWNPGTRQWGDRGRGQAGGGAPRPPVAEHWPMPGQPPERPSRPKRPQPERTQNTPAPRPQMPRRSPRGRSRSPYMRRGYGRRFDRFRRGLGRRRPAPIGGSRGRGGMSGWADPYGVARMQGYKGSRADWLQTEAGQKYQRNIDRGVMY